MTTQIGTITTAEPSREVFFGEPTRLPSVALAASASSTETAVFVARGAVKVKKVSVVCDTALTGTGAAGAGATLRVSLRRGGNLVGAAGSVVNVAFNTGVNAGALTDYTLTKLPTYLKDGDVLTFQWVQGATGLAFPPALLFVEFGPAVVSNQ